MKWNEMKWNEMKWDEMKWNEMKWSEMKWNACNEMKWNIIISNNRLREQVMKIFIFFLAIFLKETPSEQHTEDTFKLNAERRYVFIFQPVSQWLLQTSSGNWRAKRTRKSTQVNTSLQNQNLCTDSRRVAKRIDSIVSSQVVKSRKFHAYHWVMPFSTTDYLRSTCVDLRWVAKR